MLLVDEDMEVGTAPWVSAFIMIPNGTFDLGNRQKPTLMQPLQIWDVAQLWKVYAGVPF